MSERGKDVLVSFIALLFSLLFYIPTRQIDDPADYFPKAVIVLMIALAVSLLVKVLFFKQQYSLASKEEEQDREEIDQKRKWLGIGSVILFVILMPVIGFYVTSMLFLTGLSWALAGMKKDIKSIGYPVLISCVTMGVIYVAFSYYLRVPVPDGFLF